MVAGDSQELTAEGVGTELVPVGRFYWRPGVRITAVVVVCFAWVAVAAVIATRSRHPTWSIVVASLVTLGLLTPWIVAQGFRVGVREVADGLHGREGGKTLEIAWTEVERFVYQQVAFYEFVVVERRDGTRARLYGAKRLMRWRHGGCTDDFAALLNQRLAEQSAPLAT